MVGSQGGVGVGMIDPFEPLAEGKVSLHCGDCLDVLKTLDENSIDACVTDPPYHLTSIVKRFGSETAAPAKSSGATGVYKRSSAGFMGKQWDGGDVAFQVEVWAQVYRVLKPGAHLVAFGGTRTYHRMACAIEDAGFEIRDCVMWLYGSGFPKSHDVSKGIDRAAGAEREIVGNTAETSGRTVGLGTSGGYHGDIVSGHCRDITAPATPQAAEWQGWGTALKPAVEPIILARNPLSESTIAANVLKWGTGALNIDGGRVATNGDESGRWGSGRSEGSCWSPGRVNGGAEPEGKKHEAGRWPANVIHDGSDEVVGAFPDVHGAGSAQGKQEKWADQENKEGWGNIGLGPNGARFGDSGSAARFFYTAKADSDDRLGSKHPTVKPLDLMQYLVRLVTPPRGLVLDPFAGTGTTGEACIREGMRAVLIEREAEYQEDIRRRMKLAMSGPDERSREAIKAKTQGKPVDAGPLFIWNVLP